jgi:hypothetical protein
VIKEPSRIPLDTAVDRVILIQDKDVSVTRVQFHLQIGFGELGSDILDEALALSQVDPREAACPMNRRLFERH